MSVISIAGGHYIRSIADLVFQLTRCRRDASYPDRPLSSEVDYSTVLILLLVLLVESYLAWIRHFDKKTDAKNKKMAPTYLSSLRGCKRLAKRFSEVYLLRNAIAHNHVFEYEQVWDSNGAFQCRRFDVDPSWQGESNPTVYSKYVKQRKYAEPRTKLLGLRVVPGRMGREDVLVVFEIVHQILQQLQKKKYFEVRLPSGDRHMLSIDNLQVPYQPIGQGKKQLSFPFWDLIEEIRKATK
jgi:hypothetical protein